MFNSGSQKNRTGMEAKTHLNSSRTKSTPEVEQNWTKKVEEEQVFMLQVIGVDVGQVS